ncbi:3-keto-5-aminohexanoate cleavage protein (plasmid) [Salmonella enterica subsp. enterica serovar Karamoja]|uniref:3-keto-5-aminohexanoate cleavage protein n=1 Tax=Salmonella enterica subsp. enterica serovar Karamoja TaxID=2500153 RepID=A0A3Q9MSU9_SALET|nr:3-keto-5-aminohexanoate cleavage protein [Salmonella enterica]AZT39607.1 3-keto-5-aminohexanoate cleavage protein [Salmonella enterica subsp. enterica serovar Karamoja]AZT44310.1 3-keto-5-aminohexanoate cleavage protein [Salmonella enterica subsp. enterica serovar Karamoja]
MKTFILNFTPTGMIPTKELNSDTPISVNEIIESSLEAAEIGASMIHLHARDESTGMPTVSADVYDRIISGIREHNKEVILCASLSGRNVSDPKQRANPLLLDGESKPDMGSLTLSSLNFIKQASLNAPDTIHFLAQAMKERLIAPEMEVFDLGMANYITTLRKKNLLPPKTYANVILGNIFGAQSTFSNISAIIANIPDNVRLSFGGIGLFQTKSIAYGLASGFGVRVGLEDNIWFDSERTIPATNLNLLKRVINIAHMLELEPENPSSVRTSLGLASGYGEYGLLQSY